MSSTPSTRTIDHIVHLTPPGALDETIRRFQQLGFKLIAGGTHADGLTSNALVIFEDGTYLELINFVKPISSYPPSSPEREKREKHAWASKKPGWIDFAFLGTGNDKDKLQMISEIINSRSKEESTGVEYLTEVGGGRETPEGNILKWIITSPGEKHGRGTLPFFCGDITPRDWRVPMTWDDHVHPSTAKGVSHVLLLTSAENLADLSRQITTVIGAPPSCTNDDELSWSLATVQDSRTPPTTLRLRSPGSEKEHSFLSSGISAKIYEVGIWVGVDQGTEPVSTPYGRIVWQPVSDTV